MLPGLFQINSAPFFSSPCRVQLRRRVRVWRVTGMLAIWGSSVVEFLPWVLASCGMHWPFQSQDGLHCHHRHIWKTLQKSVWQLLILVEDKPMLTGNSHEFVEMFVMFLVIFPWTTTLSVIPITPSLYVRIWSIIYWKMSCSQARPQGSWTNLNFPHGVLKVVSSDDSLSRTMHRLDEVPSSLVKQELSASSWVISSTVGIL